MKDRNWCDYRHPKFSASFSKILPFRILVVGAVENFRCSEVVAQLVGEFRRILYRILMKNEEALRVACDTLTFCWKMVRKMMPCGHLYVFRWNSCTESLLTSWEIAPTNNHAKRCEASRKKKHHPRTSDISQSKIPLTLTDWGIIPSYRTLPSTPCLHTVCSHDTFSTGPSEFSPGRSLTILYFLKWIDQAISLGHTLHILLCLNLNSRTVLLHKTWGQQ